MMGLFRGMTSTVLRETVQSAVYYPTVCSAQKKRAKTLQELLHPKLTSRILFNLNSLTHLVIYLSGDGHQVPYTEEWITHICRRSRATTSNMTIPMRV